MHKIILIIIAIVALVATIIIFSPPVGGPLCGPICPRVGLHRWEKACLGIKIHRDGIDTFSDTCIGIPLGEKKCYGVPRGKEGFENVHLPCDYQR